MYDTCVCVDADNAPDVYECKLVTAKKEHRCCECNGKILKGSKYEYARGLWDGHWSDFRTCLTCTYVREDLFNCGFTHGTLWEDVYYAFDAVIPPGEKDNLDWLK